MRILPPRIPRLRGLDVEVAFRAAVAVVVPLLILMAIGRLDWGAYAAFGAFTALYGRSEPYRQRVVSMTVAAVGLVLCIAAGSLLAAAAAPLWGVALVLIAVTTVGTLVAAAIDLLPRGPLFFVFALLVCAGLPTPVSELGQRMLVAVLSAAFAWALGMSGWVLRRLTPGRLSRVYRPLGRVTTRRSIVRNRRVWLAVVQNGTGALAAGGIAVALGIGHPYWAVVSLTAVIPPPHGPNSTVRAIERIVGTALGVGAAAVLLVPNPSDGVLVVAIGVCQFVTELLVGWFYAAALVFITPLALSVSELGRTTAVGPLLGDRLLETVLGAGIGLILVVIGRWVVRDGGSGVGASA
ncbi:FUSC family protein [Planctomonas sp. JC2975]|uniref:FUSC family protein n=1 Tax=Planctomonas sp. JC2975 TaxID=2729626 RepID=UPI0014750282|nr:FUSC family protein [Planctomonas sp. JC2975]NNC11783.1 FUSC family protein [Planctomonas sp. JC2975]